MYTLKMNFVYFVFLPIILYFSPSCMVQALECKKLSELSGVIHDSTQRHTGTVIKCWIIEVLQNSFVKLDLKELNFNSYTCSKFYIKITESGTDENYTFCYQHLHRKPITALNDVNITYHLSSTGIYSTSFKLYYITENLICAQKNHFRCSPNLCIHQYQVCNGVKDCPNGSDEVGCEKGIITVRGMNVSRDNTILWLKRQRSASFGWGKNTHRAITALYLTKPYSFLGDSFEEELIVKQLELQTSVALLRNSTNPISVSELSMFLNALTVTCHNPRQFYGYNLLKILGERVSTLKSPNPSAYLTLCNSNWTISESDIKSLLKLLHEPSKYPFHLDVQAVAVMALTCMKNNKSNIFRNTVNAESLYNTTIEKFLSRQLSDGSFGNVYTTALVTQALISSGQENNKHWNVTATARYLMGHLNSSSIDFLSAYLTLPIFSGRTLVDIPAVDCSNITRKQGEDDEISEVTDKLGAKMIIQYSLYVGDERDVIHTMYLRMPENSSAYDVMRVAQVADPKYKFLHRDVYGQMYVYEIAGITNDPEAGKFWLFYTGYQYINGTIKHHTESPDKFILQADDHLIMWYRTAHF